MRRLVGPDLGGQVWNGGWAADEAFRMSPESGVKNDLTLSQDGGGLAEVDRGRTQHADAGVAMFVVVPGEETLAMSAAVLDAAEAVRKIRAVLESPKLTF